MSQIADTVQAVREDLNRILLERATAVDNALLALLTRQHYLQISREPGTAKTMLAEAVADRLTGIRYFDVCFTPGTTADEVLGPVDMLAYADHGKRRRCYARSFAEADLAFLDEIGRGNDLVYPVLLPLMGDKRTVNELGMDARLTIPLTSVFAASNTHLGDERLEALNNRFLLREEIPAIQDDASLIALATKPPEFWSEVRATMTLDELNQASHEARAVEGTTEVLRAALDLKATLRAEGVAVTGRMWKWSFPLLKAHAWLHGAQTITLEDLSVLAHAWWCDPKHKAVVQRAIYAVSNPLDLRALTVEDEALDLLKSLPHEDDPDFVAAGENVNVQLQDMLQTLIREIKSSRARDKRKALASLQRVHTAHAKFGVAYASRTNLGHIDLSAVLAGV